MYGKSAILVSSVEDQNEKQPPTVLYPPGQDHWSVSYNDWLSMLMGSQMSEINDYLLTYLYLKNLERFRN
jgi:hypothetical protein